MRSFHTGQMVHKSGLDVKTDLSLAGAVATNPEYIRSTMTRRICGKCGWLFSLWSINKARSTGTIKCPQCGTRHDIQELVQDGKGQTGH